MTSVATLLETKGHDVWSIGPDATVYEAVKLMDQKGIGALVVLHDGHLIGIIGERDYARKVILHGRASKETKVREIMTTGVYYVLPEEDVNECLAVMTHRRIRHLPVVEGERLVGMISIGDVVKHVIAEQQSTIEHLEHYLSWQENY